MTASIIQPVEDVASRFEALLERARLLKNSDSVLPSLPQAEFSGKLGLPPGDTLQRIHHTAVEIAAKKLLQSTLASLTIGSSQFGQIWNLLDIVQILGDQGSISTNSCWDIG
jgi:hypothetical protein